MHAQKKTVQLVYLRQVVIDLVSPSGAEILRVAQGALADGSVQIFLSAAGQAELELTDRALGGELGAASMYRPI